MRKRVSVITALLAALPAAVNANDGSVLYTTRDRATAGAVALGWTGPGPQFEVYRSSDLATLFDPASRLTTAFGLTYIDAAPPPDALLYYAFDSVCITPAPGKPDDAFVDANCDGIDGRRRQWPARL